MEFEDTNNKLLESRKSKGIHIVKGKSKSSVENKYTKSAELEDKRRL